MLHERIVTPIRAMLRDVGVDVQDVKLAVLREHRSQMGEWDPTEMITQWAREQGKRRGLAAAEAFRRMVLNGP